MIEQEPFGEVDGRRARAFRLDGGAGITARFTDYGARLTELHVPGRDGATADIVLGFDDAGSYVSWPAYFGATVGRYGNRIRRGQLSLLGRDYALDRNEGQNHLHGGRHGWDSRFWDVEPGSDARSITFRTVSPDGEMGYPGACDVRSTYELDGRTLRITMEAVPEAATVINMVHHSYFNLAGHASGAVMDHELRIAGEFYTPVDDELLPTGEVRAVAGTPFDFRVPQVIGRSIEALERLRGAEGSRGLDHNWCLGGAAADGLIPAAEVHHPASGRTLRLRSSEPGVQVYTGGYLDDLVVGKVGARYRQFGGFTLETQKFPDSPRFAHFPTAVVREGDTYRHQMVLDFSVD